MNPIVSIIMGSTSDMKVVRAAAEFLDEMEVPFELLALSAHRTPEKVAKFAEGAKSRGVKVIIAAAGGAAHLPGVIAASTTLPVIGIPIRSSNSMDAWDSVLSILQMPSGIPVATVAVDAAKNAAILAIEILSLSDEILASKFSAFKEGMKNKIIRANEDLKSETFKFRVL